MSTVIIQIAARCGHTTEQAINPSTEATIREVAGRFSCTACKATANPFAQQRKYGRGRMSSR